MVNLYKKTSALIEISRPLNVLIAFLTIFIAAAVTGGLQINREVVLAAISTALITIGANVINDIFDVAIDRINKPYRPLPAGKLTRNQALIYFLVVYLAGWIIAALINMTMFLIAVLISILLVFYSVWYKRTILFGNMVVSFSTAVAFVYGGLAVGRIKETFFPAVFAFLFHFGREVIKDLQDTIGDRQAGAVTFAVKYGHKPSFYLTLVVFLVLILVTLIPYILKIYNLAYLLVVILGIYPVIGLVLYVTWKTPEQKKLGWMSTILKVDMLVGLLAIYVG
jgi:geranylgeranylglycerol-phosphate geranylgeranyltransferase